MPTPTTTSASTNRRPDPGGRGSAFAEEPSFRLDRQAPALDECGFEELALLVADHPSSAELARFAVTGQGGTEWTVDEIRAHLVLCASCSREIEGLPFESTAAPPRSRLGAFASVAAALIALIAGVAMVYDERRAQEPPMVAESPGPQTGGLFSDAFESGLDGWTVSGHTADGRQAFTDNDAPLQTADSSQ